VWQAWAPAGGAIERGLDGEVANTDGQSIDEFILDGLLADGDEVGCWGHDFGGFILSLDPPYHSLCFLASMR
jgi:hypothetical protein